MRFDLEPRPLGDWELELSTSDAEVKLELLRNKVVAFRYQPRVELSPDLTPEMAGEYGLMGVSCLR